MPNDKTYTNWYRIKFDPNKKEWVVLCKEHNREKPDLVPGSEIYLNRTDAFQALFRALALEFEAWD